MWVRGVYRSVSGVSLLSETRGHENSGIRNPSSPVDFGIMKPLRPDSHNLRQNEGNKAQSG